MYDEQLEKLIDIAVKEGEVSESSRRVVINKAIKLGIDEDEIIMVLEDRLQERRKALGLVGASATSAPVSASNSKEKKCPDCGAPRTPGAKFCLDCGFKFPSIVKDLSDELAAATARGKAEMAAQSNAQADSGWGSSLKSSFNKGGLVGLFGNIIDGTQVGAVDKVAEYQKEVIDNIPIIEDRDELLEVVEFLYQKHQNNELPTKARPKLLSLMKEAHKKFSDNPQIQKRLEQYYEATDRFIF